MNGKFGINEPKLSIFLGAGFSKWAGNLPLASELFDFKIEPFGSRDKSKLSTVRLYKEKWDINNPNGETEQFIAYAISFSEKIREIVLWYITRRLSESYIWHEWHAGRCRRHVLTIDENRKNSRPGVLDARNFLMRLLPQISGIITTNYDLLIEYALGTKLFNYGQQGEVLIGRGSYPVSQWKNPVSLHGSLRLVKIHGSISWDSHRHYTDGRRGITGDALIVAPTPEKTPPSCLDTEWKLFSQILSVSNCILIFGFAFNPYDEAVLNYLKQYGSHIEHVIVVDKIHKPDRIASIWPRACVQLLTPPPKDDDSQGKWYAEFNRILSGISK